jgi:hypothetical protein
MRELSWRERLRYLVFCGVVTVALLSPYLLFIQANGGVGFYLEEASAWAARERERTPVVWPGLFDYPDGISDEAREGWIGSRAVAVVRDNSTAFWYYLEIALPLLALVVVAVSRDAFRPEWGRAAPKVAVVAILGVILNAGFLRSPLNSRLADPSVPHAIVIAWLLVAVPRMLRRPDLWKPAVQRWRQPIAALVVVAALLLGSVIVATESRNFERNLEVAGLTEGPRTALRQAGHVADTVRRDWELATWVDREDRPDLLTLAMYLNACTPAESRVFVQPYIPAVLALARRGFAGGHADLRPGFFTSEASQRLTLERLRRQDVPVALLETGDSLRNFRDSFPLITAYLDEQYQVAATHVFDERFGITLLLKRDVRPTHSFAALGWPCAS